MKKGLKAAPKLSIAMGCGDPAGGMAASPLLFPEGEVKFRDRDLEWIQELGSGAGGSVAKVLHVPTNSIMARKNINLNVDGEADRKKAERNMKAELKILHMCRSEYIVSSFGAFSFEGCVSICMEFMDLGSLETIYKRVGPIPQDTVARIAVHVLRGLVYLTQMNIVHRDIKPSNILVNTQGNVKIADFGVSKEVTNTKARTFTGTQGYLAPERIQGVQDYSVVSDIWSLGLSLIEIATARFPYPPEGHPPMSIFDLISYIGDNPAPTLPPGRFSPEFEDFIAHAVTKDAKNRPGPERLLQHPCCLRVEKEGISLLSWAQSLAVEKEE
ncbi:MAP kinase kinase (MEK) [Irineochytrium annulatum]|nr:MAP kinase kinase (MEK) [Irineochytrium annulatum]